MESQNLAPPIAFLGGTFDPVHLGHIQVAQDVAQQLGLSDLRVMPNYIPPHRPQPSLDSALRLKALEQAVQDVDGLSIELSEWRAGEAGEITAGYTVESLERLRQQYPDTPLVFVMGMDAYQAIETWKHYTRLPELCHLVIMTRAEVNAELTGTAHDWLQTKSNGSLENAIAGTVRLCEVSAIPISSTKVRAALAANESLQDLLPAAIIPLLRTLDT